MTGCCCSVRPRMTGTQRLWPAAGTLAGMHRPLPTVQSLYCSCHYLHVLSGDYKLLGSRWNDIYDLMTCREYQLYNQHLDNHVDSEPAAEWDCLTFQSLLGYNITDISCYKENYGKLVEDRRYIYRRWLCYW